MLATAPRRVKQAVAPGSSDTSFEQSFSSLAHNFLADRAPALLDHEVGFQVLSKQDDNTRAVGVIGCQVGDKWIYIPVFFLNGDLKVGDMFLPQAGGGMFLPLKENWVNYVLSRQPIQLGEGVTRNSRSLGVVGPNLTTLSIPRGTAKYSSALPSWLEPGIASLAHASRLGSFKLDLPDLPTFLKTAGRKVLTTFLKMCREQPQIAVAFEQFHGPIEDVVKAAHKMPNFADQDHPATRQDPLARGSSIVDLIRPEANRPDLMILTKEAAANYVVDLNDAERQTLLRDGVLIRDKRAADEISHAYAVPTRIQTEKILTNPTRTDIYDVLVRPGNFDRMLVIVRPYCDDGTKDFVTVVRTGKKPAWINTDARNVWVKEINDDQQRNEWYKDLPGGKDSLKKGGLYVAVCPDGRGTVPFEVSGPSLADATYPVWYRNYSSGPVPSHKRNNAPNGYYDGDGGTAHIHLNDREGSSLTRLRNDIYLPPDAKIIQLKEPPKPSKSDYDSCCIGKAIPDELIDLAGPRDLDRALREKTSQLRISHNGTEVRINDELVGPDIHALAALVGTHGLGEASARAILKEAAQHGHLRVLVKYAGPYDLQQSTPGAPAFPPPLMGGADPRYGDVPVQYSRPDFLPVDELSASRTDPNLYSQFDTFGPQQNTLGTAMQAARTGQKEVFDVGMMNSLVKATNDDAIIARNLPDIMRGLGKLCQLRFLFYWHNDMFKERYGQADMPELEDGLRNAIESCGDVVLFLKERNVEADSMGGTAPSLDDTEER